MKSRVLVVANRTASSDALLAALQQRAERSEASFTLLVPATARGGVTAQAARETAEGQLRDALDRFAGAGLEVDGAVGDADPLVAVMDVWDPKEYDEIIVSTLPEHASAWLAVDLPHRIARHTDAVVRHVVASEARQRVPTLPREAVRPAPPRDALDTFGHVG